MVTFSDLFKNKSFKEKYDSLTEELKEIKETSDKKKINKWFYKLIDFNKSENRKKIREEAAKADNLIIEKIQNEICSQLDEERKQKIFQQEIEKEQKKIFQKGVFSLNNTRFFGNLGVIEEETIFNCLTKIKNLAINRAKFEVITSNLLYFYKKTSLISEKVCRSIGNIIRKTKVDSEEEINASLKQIINEFRQEITGWDQLPSVDINNIQSRSFVQNEVLSSLDYLKYAYETELKDEVINKGKTDFSEWKDIKELTSKYQELIKTKKIWEMGKAEKDTEYYQLIMNNFLNYYSILKRYGESPTFKEVEIACEELKLLEENNSPKVVKKIYEDLGWDNIGSKTQELEEYIDKWKELKTTFSEILGKVNKNVSDYELATLIPQVKKEFENKLEEYIKKKDPVIDWIIANEELTLEHDWKSELELYPIKNGYRQRITKILQEAQEIDNSVDIENWEESLYSKVNEGEISNFFTNLERKITDKSYISVRGSTEELLQSINLAESSYSPILDELEEKVKNEEIEIKDLKKWKVEVQQDLEFVVQEWTNNLKSPENIEEFKEKLIVSSLPRQTRLGKLALDQKKEEIKGYLKIYSEAFTQAKSHLDKISQAVQQREKSEVIKQLREGFYKFFHSGEPNDPPTRNPEYFK